MKTFPVAVVVPTAPCDRPDLVNFHIWWPYEVTLPDDPKTRMTFSRFHRNEDSARQTADRFNRKIQLERRCAA